MPIAVPSPTISRYRKPTATGLPLSAAGLPLSAVRMTEAARNRSSRAAAAAAVTARPGAALRAGAQRILAAVEAAAVRTDVRDEHPGIVVHVRQSTAGSAGNLSALLRALTQASSLLVIS
jgi:hypothetical protein